MLVVTMNKEYTTVCPAVLGMLLQNSNSHAVSESPYFSIKAIFQYLLVYTCTFKNKPMKNHNAYAALQYCTPCIMTQLPY